MASIQHGGISGSIGSNGVNGSARMLQKIAGSVNGISGGNKEVVSNTTDGWNSQPQLIASKDVIYVYTDYKIVDDTEVPNIKIGDGKAYLIDLPFLTLGTTYSIATTSSDGLMSSSDKTKIDGIETGAEVNQNAFSKIAVSGQTTVEADSKTDTLTISAGDNVTLTTDATNDKVTISAQDTTYSTATTSSDGLMSYGDKTKLDDIETGAEVNQNAFSNIAVSGQTTVAADSKTDTLTLAAGDNVTLTTDATNDKVTISAQDTTYSSKEAASGGTDVSLVTTGEKYTWNNKQNALVRPVTGDATWTAADVITTTNASSGNAIKESGKTIATSITNVDTTVPTSKAVKAYVDGSTEVLPELVDDGAKNIADMSKTKAVFPDESTGATITRNGDLFTINGTTKATGSLVVNIYFDTATTKIIPDGDYVAQLFPYSNNIKVQAVGTSVISGENAQPLEFSITSSDTRSWIRIEVDHNTTFNNHQFRLMICKKVEWDISQEFRSCGLTNAELTKYSPRIVVRSETTLTTSTNLEDTGISYTIPASKMVRITATARYSAGNPVEIALGTGSSMFAHEVAVTGDNVYSLTASSYIGGFSADQIVKVFAKYKTASSNIIYFMVEEIPDQ